jgi:hypothetical protein
MSRELLHLYSAFSKITSHIKNNNFLCNYCLEHYTDLQFFNINEEYHKMYIRNKKLWIEIIEKIRNNSIEEESKFGIEGDNVFLKIPDFDMVFGVYYPMKHNLDSGIMEDYINEFLYNFFTNKNNGYFEYDLFESFKNYYTEICKNDILKNNIKKVDSKFENIKQSSIIIMFC